MSQPATPTPAPIPTPWHRQPSLASAVSLITLDRALALCAEGAVIATVNRRLSRHLADRYERSRVESGALWWETAQILPLSSWLVSLHDQALTLGLSERARVSPLVAQRRWARLVAERHGTLLDVDAAARDAMRAWQLGHAWDVLPDAEDYLSDDQYAWQRWAEVYAGGLESESLIDEATLPHHIVGMIDAGGLELPSRLVLAGFLDPTPAERHTVATLAAAGVEILVIVDGARAVPRCRSWPDDACELRAIADATHARLARDPAAVIGVVVPDLNARRTEVLRAFDRRFFPALTPAEIERIGRPYDLSLGSSLADTAPARSALLALTLAWGSLDRHGVSALLLSPYLRAAAAECRARERLDRKLREWRVRSMWLSRFAKVLDDSSELRKPLMSLVGRCSRASKNGHGSLSDWADRFGDCLSAFGWPGEGLSSEEYQSVQAWHSVLDDVQALDDGHSVSLVDALGLVKRLARERLFQTESPEVPIRILGRLESHGLHFDALWIAGLDSEHWPPSASPSPFLPIVKQKDASMPEASPGARLALANAEFAHWCASADEVFASHALERGGKPLVPAAVLVGIEPGTLDDPDPMIAVRETARVETLADAAGPVVVADGKVGGGARLLEDQAKCPFRAFALHRLEIRPLEEATLGLDARQRGTQLHRALEFFWQETRSHEQLLALDAAALDGRIATCVDRAVAEDQFMEPVLASLERRRLTALLAEWIETAERTREPFEVVGYEQEVEFERDGVQVKLKIDRIDRIDGRLVVLDYKSGISDRIRTWDSERIINPQLPLYALAKEDVAGVAFARVAQFNCRFLGVTDEAGLLPRVDTKVSDDSPADWAGWRLRWAESIGQVAAEVRNGLAGVSPQEKACDFCDLRALCRIDEPLLSEDSQPGATNDR